MKNMQFLLVLLIVFGLAVPVFAKEVVVYVDDDAAVGGDGSEASPVQTIQEGLALLPAEGGTVKVYPGTYIGPILVNGSGRTIEGLATPVLDADGYLSHFMSDDPYDDEVVVTIDRELRGAFEDPLNLEPEDVLELQGSDNKVEKIVVDLGSFAPFNLNSAVSAKAEDDDFYDNIEFSYIVVRGPIDTPGWTRKANAKFKYFTALDFGFVGINPAGNGHVEIEKAHLGSKGANVCFLGLWEFPRGDNGPSLLTGEIKDSKLVDAVDIPEIRLPGIGLLLMAQGGQTNHLAPSTVIVEASNIHFEGNEVAINTRPLGGGPPPGADRLISLEVEDNTYVDNGVDAEVSFLRFGSTTSYTRFSTVIVQDKDGVFPSTFEVDLGPPENANIYVLEGNN